MKKTVAALVLGFLLAGCAAPATDVAPPASVLGLDAAGGPIVALLRDASGMRVRQAVDVVLVGFEAGMGETLQEKLEPLELRQQGWSAPYSWPGYDELPVYIPSPLAARVEYRVTQVDATVAAAFFASLTPFEDNDTLFDGNDVETKLVALLSEQAIGPRAGHPLLVTLHAQDQLPAGHGYRYAYPYGKLDGVRIFGEREELLVADVSAAPDGVLARQRETGTTPPNDGGYTEPLPPGGEGTTAALGRLVEDATRLRLVKGSFYPVSVAPCHHVTLILAIHTTSLTHQLARPAQDWVDLLGLEGAYENLTGEEVLVDFKVLMLPQDDPVLDAMIRNVQVTAAMMRDHLDKNFETYVDVTPGCEEYLAINLFADATTPSPLVLGNAGVAMYDVDQGRRLAFGWMPELSRILDHCTGEPAVDDNVPTFSNSACNVVNFVYAHEVGHLFGMWHTQSLPPETGDTSEADLLSDPSLAEFGVDFQSVWSTMGYRQWDRMHDFSQLDHENWVRARAAHAVHAAQQLSLDKTPAFAQAMTNFERYAWSEGYHALAPHLAPQPAAGTAHAQPPTAWTWSEDLSWLFEGGHDHAH